MGVEILHNVAPHASRSHTSAIWGGMLVDKVLAPEGSVALLALKNVSWRVWMLLGSWLTTN